MHLLSSTVRRVLVSTLVCTVLAACQSFPTSIPKPAFVFDALRPLAPGVEIAHVEGESTSVWIAVVDLFEPRVRVELAYFPHGSTVSEAARASGALVAVNAGPYTKDASFRPWTSFKTRTGKLITEAKPSSAALVQTSAGVWTIVPASGASESDALVFGGYGSLVEGGSIVVPERPEGREEERAREPRTAVGLNSDATKLILLVADGRRWNVPGLTLEETALWMKAAGSWSAFNADGGGSSTFVYEIGGVPRVANVPQGVPIAGGERAVATVLTIVRSEEVDR